VVEFLFREANRIDDREFDEWLDMMTDDVEYVIPSREIRERGSSPFQDIGIQEDNRYRLEKRVERLKTDYAWADDPPPQTRHVVSNVLAERRDDPELVDATSNLLLVVCDRSMENKVLSGSRTDLLRDRDGDLKLARREVRLDQTTVPFSINFFV